METLLTSEWAQIEYDLAQLKNKLFAARKVSHAHEMPESTQQQLLLLIMEAELWEANLSL